MLCSCMRKAAGGNQIDEAEEEEDEGEEDEEDGDENGESSEDDEFGKSASLALSVERCKP